MLLERVVPMEVRVYTGDVNRLRHLAESWQLSTNTAFNFDVKIETFLDTLKVLIDHPDGDLLVLESKGGRALGLMGIFAVRSPIGDEDTANEKFFYVLPKYRGMGGKRLIEFATKWAKKNNCKKFLITASRLANVEHDRVCRLYKKLGFEHFETVFNAAITE